MAKDSSNLYVVSIVAVVAVVGMMTLFMGGGVGGSDANIAGQAFYSKGEFSEPAFAPVGEKIELEDRAETEMETDFSGCTDTDAWSGIANVTFIAGNVTMTDSAGAVAEFAMDECISEDVLLEYSCVGKDISKRQVSCSAGCEFSWYTGGFQCARP